MKTLFAFFAILGIAGGILAFCFFSPVIAAFALFLYLLVGGGFVFSFAYNHGLRKNGWPTPFFRILRNLTTFSGNWRSSTRTGTSKKFCTGKACCGWLKNAKPKSYKPGRIRKRTGKKRLKETTAAWSVWKCLPACWTSTTDWGRINLRKKNY